jgi:hypothetical protein
MSGISASNPELTAICHLVPMDAGLFCISLAEAPSGTVGPNYPGVRISLPPGSQADHAGVTISTFRADGWLDRERPAALVHVAHGRAHVMLTIYHEAAQPHEAPRLSILQLAQVRPHGGPATVPSGLARAGVADVGGGLPAGAAFVPMPPTPPEVVTGFAPPATLAPTPAPVFGAAATRGQPTEFGAALAEAQILAHVHNRGDVRTRLTDWVGLPGGRLWIEGFSVTLPPGTGMNEVEYQGHSRSGPTPWTSAPDFCGSRGQTLPLLGLAIRLKGAAAQLYDCSYRASFVDGSTAGPTAQGQLCQSGTQAPLEAFQVTLTRR